MGDEHHPSGLSQEFERVCTGASDVCVCWCMCNCTLCDEPRVFMWKEFVVHMEFASLYV